MWSLPPLDQQSVGEIVAHQLSADLCDPEVSSFLWERTQVQTTFENEIFSPVDMEVHLFSLVIVLALEFRKRGTVGAISTRGRESEYPELLSLDLLDER